MPGELLPPHPAQNLHGQSEAERYKRHLDRLKQHTLVSKLTGSVGINKNLELELFMFSFQGTFWFVVFSRASYSLR